MMSSITISSTTWLVTGLFLSVTVLHAASLKRLIPWPFRMHLWVMGWLWVVVILSVAYLIVSLPINTLFPPVTRIIGGIIILIGLGVAIWSEWLLDWSRSMGRRFFLTDHLTTWIRSGPYRVLENPIYDATFLIFVGLFLWHGNFDFLLVAFASVLFLNLFLSRVENR